MLNLLNLEYGKEMIGTYVSGILKALSLRVYNFSI